MGPSAMDEPVPVQKSLHSLYDPDALPAQEKRWNSLRTEFQSIYKHPPSFVSRSPGRVNIIGEHIDYSLYEVLPMGIVGDVIIAVSSTSTTTAAPAKILLANLDPRFKPTEFSLTPEHTAVIDATTHEWSNYIKAGLNGALKYLNNALPNFTPQNLSLLVHGTVPAGGGLSSSAALVCAVSLAVIHAHSPSNLTKRALVELAIVSERAVGVNSGGMDQAASVASVRGQALTVSFSPHLHAEAIPFPKTEPAIKFMIAQSFVVSDKQVTGPVCYNLRVVECSLAAQYLASCLGLTLEEDSGPLGCSLRGLQNAFFAQAKVFFPDASDPDIARLEIMVQLVHTHLTSTTGYTREEIAAKLSTTIPALETQYMTTFPIRASVFQLRLRALHVFTEAIRVHKFVALLRAPPPSTPEASKLLLQNLGDLMNDTQRSCREDYDCSCEELDELCRIARSAGAYGSRLTGAGWGGCSVHLVPRDRVEEVRAAWGKEYYGVRFPGLSVRELEEAVVVSEPGHGAMM